VRRLRLFALAAVGVILGAQLIRPIRDNPPAQSNIKAPEAITAMLHRACYDCHSNQTNWPWYSAFAPVSWVVSAHVHEGREKLNFSEWDDYASDPGTLAQKLKAIAQLVGNQKMPPWYYQLTHPEARLSDGPRDELVAWARRESANAEASEH